jgi:hypothetical protein
MLLMVTIASAVENLSAAIGRAFGRPSVDLTNWSTQCLIRLALIRTNSWITSLSLTRPPPRPPARPRVGRGGGRPVGGRARQASSASAALISSRSNARAGRATPDFRTWVRAPPAPQVARAQKRHPRCAAVDGNRGAIQRDPRHRRLLVDDGRRRIMRCLRRGFPGGSAARVDGMADTVPGSPHHFLPHRMTRTEQMSLCVDRTSGERTAGEARPTSPPCCLARR